MADDYIPYEQRRRQASQHAEAAAELEANRHAALVTRVKELLAVRHGAGTDAYLELLKPAKAFAPLLRRKQVIRKPGVHGGPDFVIGEVVPAYRLPLAIVEPPYQDGTGTVFDAFVAPDGRVWRFAGSGETDNTYQLLASSVERLVDMRTDDLARIATGLQAASS